MGANKLQRTFVRLLGLAVSVLVVVAVVDWFVDTDAEQIDRQIERGRRALEARDAEKLCEVLDPDFELLEDLGPLRARGTDLASLRTRLQSLFAQCTHVRADVEHRTFLESDAQDPALRSVRVEGFLRIDRESIRVPLQYGLVLDFVLRDSLWRLRAVREVKLDVGVF